MSTDHAQWCRNKSGNHEDAAKRIADQYMLHRLAADALGINNVGKFFAAALNDGTSDGVLYDSKRDAVRHQKHNEQFYTYIKIGLWSMNACEAAVMLRTARMVYDKGLRMADPDSRGGGREVIQRSSIEDVLALSRGRVRNIILPFNPN